MGFFAFATIVILAVVAGYLVQRFTRKTFTYEWLIVALAGAFGAYFASETLTASFMLDGIKNWGPQIDGMVVIPALLGGTILALIADFGMRIGSQPLPS